MILDEKKKNQFLAAAQIVEHGELAILKSILQFQDRLDDFNEEFQKIVQPNKESWGAIEANKTSIEELANFVDDLVVKIKSLSEKDVTAQLKIELRESLKNLDSALAKRIEEVRELIPTLPPETNLTDIYNKLILLEDFNETFHEEFINDLPKYGSQFRDGLELLVKDERLKIEAINKLREELDELKKSIQRVSGGSVVGGVMGIKEIVAGTNITVDNTQLGYPVVSATGGGGALVSEVPAEAVDGATAIFTFTNNPVAISVDGLLRRNTKGYTISGAGPYTVTVDSLSVPQYDIFSIY